MATNAPQDDWHKTGLRLPKDLHQRLHDAAASSGRSYNGELVARLEGSFNRHPDEGAIYQLSARLRQQEFTIATLTTLAHSLALLYKDNPGGIEVADFVLQQLEQQPDETGERERLMDALASNLNKPEKKSARHARITAKKPPQGLPKK